MLVIPAIDLRGGRCVQLTQGRLEKEYVCSNDPVFTAKLWQAEGAKRLHVVDLDGAFSGVIQHSSIVRDMVDTVQIPIELGGGIRTLESIEQALEIGVDRVILSTMVIYNRKLLDKAIGKYREHIVVAIDAMDGKVAVDGWRNVTTLSAVSLAQEMQKAGVQEIIFTDVRCDGLMTGPNIRSITNLVSKITIPVTVSGGICSLRHVEQIHELEPDGVVGAIIGKALYTGDIALSDAIRVASVALQYTQKQNVSKQEVKKHTKKKTT